MFEDREEAGKKLAVRLKKYSDQSPVILALPRSGVPLGLEIAKELNAPLDVLVTRKHGAQYNREFGFGAIASGDIEVLDQHVIEQLELTGEQISKVKVREYAELERRAIKYRGYSDMPHVEKKTVVIVNDGLATDVTARAAVKAVLQNKPAKIIVAHPVCTQNSVEMLKNQLRKDVDEIVCLSIPQQFTAVGVWYKSFNQITDDKVVQMLSFSKKK